MSASLLLPQKLALLDLMTEAKTDPERVREEALGLAQTHQVATPTEVERALAKLKPASRAYDWDRPGTQAELFARQAERQRLQKEWEKQHPRERWYHKVGLECGIMLSIGAVLPSLHISALVWKQVMETFGLDGGALMDTAWIVTALALMVSPTFIFGRLSARYYARVGAGSERMDPQEDREKPVSPTAEQAARWLAFEEVATQARAWMNSEAGLMAEDVRLLDARVEALTKATQKDREARLLAQLRTGTP